MRGIMLAAGKGARLNGTVGDLPKCLARVGGMTLVERQIAALAGRRHRRHRRRRRLRSRARPAQLRPRRAVRREHAVRADQQPVLAVAGTTSAARRLRRHELRRAAPSAAARRPADVAPRGRAAGRLSGRRRAPLGDEEMKVQVRRGRVVDISKTMPADDADGENVGVVKFGAEGARLLAAIARRAGRGRRAARLGAARVRRVRARSGRCTRSARAAIRGPRSTFPRTTSARRACCRIDCTSVRRRRLAGHRARRLVVSRGRCGELHDRSNGEIMYERFYRLRERPFALTPDPDYLYPSKVHRRRSATCATASRATPASSSSPARSGRARRRCCRRCCAASTAGSRSRAS